MTETQAMNRKCPYAFNQNMGDFLYCQTSLCMSWHEDGYCQRLVNGDCEGEGKKMTSNMDRQEIGARIASGEAGNEGMTAKRQYVLCGGCSLGRIQVRGVIKGDRKETH